MLRTLYVLVACSLICFLAFGCNFILDLDRVQCSSDGDCSGRAAGSRCVADYCTYVARCGDNECGPDESCYGDSCIDSALNDLLVCEASEEKPASVTVNLTAYAALNRVPPKDIRIRACNTTDLECESPVSSEEEHEGTGRISIQVPYGFSGYFDIEFAELLPTLLYFSEPLTRDVDPILSTLTPEEAPGLSSLLSRTVDLEVNGLVIFEGRGCNSEPLPDLHFADRLAQDIVYYAVDEFATPGLNASVADEDTSTAFGVMLEVPPGTDVFTARVRSAEGPVVGERNGIVKAGHVAWVVFNP